MKLGIMAGMPRRVVMRLAAAFQGWFCWCHCSSRRALFPVWLAHDARHHGRYGPDDQLCACSDLFKAGFDGGNASRAFPATMGRLFGALCIGTGPGGRVHRDTASIIRCICDGIWTHISLTSCQNHHHHHQQRSHFGSSGHFGSNCSLLHLVRQRGQ